MSTPEPGRRRRQRRLVILVDNGVNGDSRVQKQALTAADAGWDVTLLGKSPDKQRHTWQLGSATVVLVTVSNLLGKRRHELRRAPLRRPLAYPPGPVAASRRQQVRAWRADLAVRRIVADEGKAVGEGGLSATLGRLALAVETPWAKVMTRWVTLRERQTQSLLEARSTMQGPLDRFSTAFWQKTMGERAWRRLDPHLWDFDLAFGKEIDRLRPDVIHANDFRMLGVGARAKMRARGMDRSVHLVWDAHEFLPGIRPWVSHPRWHMAQCAHEREYAPYADAVITVSDALADLLTERHHLPEQPSVVLNAPNAEPDDPATLGDVPHLRALCGIAEDVPLAVFSGTPGAHRGLDIMVEALPRIDALHVALVVRPGSAFVTGLVARSVELGVADRLHVLPYVPHDQVSRFLAAADLGVIPIHHWPNHEIALITKFFEYSHARLPIVVSDVRTMAEMTRLTGQGEVFRAEDVDDYVRAVTAVLADPRRYRRAYETPGLLEGWTWEAQAQVLLGVYDRLTSENRDRQESRCAKLPSTQTGA